MFFKLNIGPKLIWKTSHDFILKNTVTFCFKQVKFGHFLANWALDVYI